MKAKAAPPPGSAAFVHLRWPAALERTGGPSVERSSARDDAAESKSLRDRTDAQSASGRCGGLADA